MLQPHVSLTITLRPRHNDSCFVGFQQELAFLLQQVTSYKGRFLLQFGILLSFDGLVTNMLARFTPPPVPCTRWVQDQQLPDHSLRGWQPPCLIGTSVAGLLCVHLQCFLHSQCTLYCCRASRKQHVTGSVATLRSRQPQHHGSSRVHAAGNDDSSNKDYSADELTAYEEILQQRSKLP